MRLITLIYLYVYLVFIKADENEGDGRWNTVIEEAVVKCDTPQFLSCLESIAVLRNPPLNTDQCNRIKKLSTLKNIF